MKHNEQVTNNIIFRLQKLKIYHVIIDGKNFFNQPVRNKFTTYDSIWKIVIGQGDDYATSSLLEHKYFKDCYKVIAIDLRKRQALNVDPKAIQ